MLLCDIKDDFPQFVKVVQLYVINNKQLIALVQQYETVEFDNHFCAYLLNQLNERKAVRIETINKNHPQTYMLRELTSKKKIIVPKYHFRGTLLL